MFILEKRNIIIPSPAPGVAPVVLKKDGFATVPDWAAETTYLRHWRPMVRSLPPITAIRTFRLQLKSR